MISFWKVEMSHDWNTYTLEINKCHKSGLVTFLKDYKRNKEYVTETTNDL